MKRHNIIGIGLFLSLTLVSCNSSVKINDQFTIEYMEMYSSISLRNKNQGFVANVTKAYWNRDSLVVSGNKGCYLIIFEKTEYNDEMIEINCNNLYKKLTQTPIKSFIQD